MGVASQTRLIIGNYLNLVYTINDFLVAAYSSRNSFAKIQMLLVSDLSINFVKGVLTIFPSSQKLDFHTFVESEENSKSPDAPLDFAESFKFKALTRI